MDGSLKLEYESQMELPHYFRIVLEMGSKNRKGEMKNVFIR